MPYRPLWILALTLLAVAGLWAARPALTTAQDGAPSDTLRGLLLALNAENTPFTIDFQNTVPRLGKSIDIGPGEPTDLARIGEDVVCFRVAVTSVRQVTCVPYANLNAVFYAE